MKKFYNPLLWLVFISVTFTSLGQVSYEVPSDDFPDLASVVTFINSNPAGDDGMVFTISGDTTFDEPLLTLTAQTEPSAPYIIQWDEQGSKPIVNFSGTSADAEAGITFQGARGIIVDGLDIRNPEGMLEYGVFLTNADAETGSQHNVIRNTHITLNKTNPNPTNGIRAFPSFEQTSQEGSNSNNSFVNNHISDVLIGYQLDSDTGEVDLMDTGNTIVSTEDGNHIIEDIVFSGVYLLNQNGAVIDGIHILNLNRPDDGTNTAPASISTTGTLPGGDLTEPFVISNNRLEGQFSESTSIFGMYLNQRNVHYDIFNNVLNDITSDNTGTSYASGIFIFATGATADIYNNMISGLASPASSGISVRGLYLRTFVSVNVFYNSVLIDYEATHSENVSAALSIHNSSDPVDLRNNIFVNKTTLPLGSQGFATAFLKNTAALENIQTQSDNNIYYAGTPSAQNLIFRGSTTAMDQTLADYKLRAATFDQNSYTEDVPFIASDDLHVDPLASTLVRGNAQPVTQPFAITEDIDGMLRDADNPDIGCDELPLDLPDVATNPTPADGEMDISYMLGVLQWDYLENPYFVNPAGFKVYFGENEVLTESDYIGWIEYEEGEESFSADIDVLDYTKTYYWSIVPSLDEVNGPDAEQPQVWSFTTEAFTYDYPNPAENPQPANNAENVNIDISSLSWEYIYNEMFAEPAGFLVYFGESENFTGEDLIGWVVYDDKEQNYSLSLESIELEALTNYYWKVIPTVNQEEGPEAENQETWSFTTDEQVGVIDKETNPFLMYPNPASARLFLKVPQQGLLRIVSIDGRIVKEQKVVDTSAEVSLTDLEEGIYLVNFVSVQQQISRLLHIKK